MKHLALDTATAVPCVALLQDETVLAEWQGSTGIHHGELVLEGIDHCLQQTDTTKNELEFISAGIGPGAFTGLRIGLATAKFFAEAVDRPLVAVNSLQGLAHQAVRRRLADRQTVWAVSDAKREEVFVLPPEAELADPDVNDQLDADGSAMAPQALAEIVREKRDIFFIGDGASAFADRWPDHVTVSKENKMSAVDIGLLGRQEFLRNGGQAAVAVRAIYLGAKFKPCK